jgi:hypothetical protein
LGPPLHQEPGKKIHLRGDAAAPDEVVVGRVAAAIRAELVEGGDLELPMESTRERQDVPIDGCEIHHFFSHLNP